MEKFYQGMLGVSSNFVGCGNCFRLDSYKGCSFGCKYCFANNRSGGYVHDFRVGSVDRLRTRMRKAIDLGDRGNLVNDMIGSRVPLHLGGMSDPFQSCEFGYGVTLGYLGVSREYGYPINISTKFGGFLDRSYWDVLDPMIHTFSISLCGVSDGFIRQWEQRTPLFCDRVRFIKELKDRGFWVGLRIQPIIDMDEVLRLVDYVSSNRLVDFITLEHIKIMQMNGKMCKELMPLLGGRDMFELIDNEYRIPTAVKCRNIERIKGHTDIPIGVGDDDLHHMSDSLNCCGMDLMPNSFKNWSKCNSMYIDKTDDRNFWSSRCDCNRCFNPKRQKVGCVTMMDYVDYEYSRTDRYKPIQLGLFD